MAAGHLEREGWTMLHRKFRVGKKEIDLVARRGEVVAFVEVKTRGGGRNGGPLESIDSRKRAQIGDVAAGWVSRFGDETLTYRFDAVAVVRGRDGSVVIEHIEDAWRL